ncbi:3-deoxy-D-manno-octulosonic-acid transferase [Sinobacterium caligoides]|uniref:3-deoxy-D-manno-octulosonic acid transferase n=1 Tax=Sinobacterium caligoides TaxID=933926 RepID=A0A3N2DG91_9GAMM|nr:lipid IV(A) 3-deoxy-D-manno-octulosonic acid transferase [Sinobacterium caligoides]ROR98813.1 3-deoxy-D-manno-octulosonic-acid transferase [Sinobacterium caligoides]
MVRVFYSLLFYLLQPLFLLRLLWRSIKAPAYRQRLLERYALYFKHRLNNKPTIWVHAVSVGETIAAAPMVRELQRRYPNHSLLVTTTTPTGSDRVHHLFRGSVEHVYAPYDLPLAQWRFLRRYQPVIAIVMETELWPNMVAACHGRGVPVLLANARLSAKSARGYAKFSRLTRPMLRRLSCVAAQNGTDGQRFLELGLNPDNLLVSGSIKFDVELDNALRAQAEELRRQWHQNHRLVIIAASTHAGEDEQLLNAVQQLDASREGVLLVLVPRHPERFEAVATLVQERGLQLARRSREESVQASTEVLLADTMGEMLLLLGASDVAFVGGSLIEHGGHNVLEPALWRLPVLTGPHMYNFQEITEQLESQGGLKRVTTEVGLLDELRRLSEDECYRVEMGENAYRVVKSNRGALDKLLAVIAKRVA